MANKKKRSAAEKMLDGLTVIKIDEEGATEIKLGQIPGFAEMIDELSSQVIRDDPFHQAYLAGMIEMGGNLYMNGSHLLVLPFERRFIRALKAVWGGKMKPVTEEGEPPRVAWKLSPFEQYRLLVHIVPHLKARNKEVLAYVKDLRTYLQSTGELPREDDDED